MSVNDGNEGTRGRYRSDQVSPSLEFPGSENPFPADSRLLPWIFLVRKPLRFLPLLSWCSCHPGSPEKGHKVLPLVLTFVNTLHFYQSDHGNSWWIPQAWLWGLLLCASLPVSALEEDSRLLQSLMWQPLCLWETRPPGYLPSSARKQLSHRRAVSSPKPCRVYCSPGHLPHEDGLPLYHEALTLRTQFKSD